MHLHHHALVLMALTCLMLAGTAGAELIPDGGFEDPGAWAGYSAPGGLDTWQLDTGDADNMWHHCSSDWRLERVTPGGNPGAYAAIRNPYSARGLGLKIPDGKTSTGLWTLSFDLKADGYEGAGYLHVSVYGIDDWTTGGFGLKGDADGTSQGLPAPGSVPLLVVTENEIPLDQAFDWTSFSYPVDLGSGYDTLVVRVAAKDFNTPGLGVDNISLTPEPITLCLLVAGTLALRRRR